MIFLVLLSHSSEVRDGFQWFGGRGTWQHWKGQEMRKVMTGDHYDDWWESGNERRDNGKIDERDPFDISVPYLYDAESISLSRKFCDVLTQ